MRVIRSCLDPVLVALRRRGTVAARVPDMEVAEEDKCQRKPTEQAPSKLQEVGDTNREAEVELRQSTLV